MTLPTRIEAQAKLEEYTTNEYLLLHAKMVATSMEGYAELYEEDKDLYYITGLLHDVDYEQFPDTHPGPSLQWFEDWGYSKELIHAVEAHALGFNGFTTQPNSRLAKTLMACDEICGIFFAYQKLNPIPYSQMKVSSFSLFCQLPSEPNFSLFSLLPTALSE